MGGRCTLPLLISHEGDSPIPAYGVFKLHGLAHVLALAELPNCVAFVTRAHDFRVGTVGADGFAVSAPRRALPDLFHCVKKSLISHSIFRFVLFVQHGHVWCQTTMLLCLAEARHEGAQRVDLFLQAQKEKSACRIRFSPCSQHFGSQSCQRRVPSSRYC